jgi:hypothetical protein
MIYCNGNIEFQSSLNEKEAKWWQNRIQELGSKSEIISRNPAEVTSVEEVIEYLKIKGRGIAREAILGCKLAKSVAEAYKMFYDVQCDPFGHAYLEMSVNDYIQSKPYTLSIENSEIIA